MDVKTIQEQIQNGKILSSEDYIEGRYQTEFLELFSYSAAEPLLLSIEQSLKNTSYSIQYVLRSVEYMFNNDIIDDEVWKTSINGWHTLLIVDPQTDEAKPYRTRCYRWRCAFCKGQKYNRPFRELCYIHWLFLKINCIDGDSYIVFNEIKSSWKNGWNAWGLPDESIINTIKGDC